MRKIKIDTGKSEYLIILTFLFLAAMNFYAKFFYFVFAAFIMLIFTKQHLKVNIGMIPYILLGSYMAVYNADEGVLSVFRCFAYALCFIIGSNMILSISNNGLSDNGKFENQIRIGYAVLSAICLGSFVHFMLNFAINQQFVLGRNTNDIWTGERLSATIQASIACLMCGFGVSMIICPRKKFSRLVGIIAIIGIMAYNLMLAGRTLLIMIILVLAIGLVYFCLNSERPIHKNNTIIIVISIFVAIALAFTFNIAGVQDYILESNLFSRLDSMKVDGMISGERTRRKILFLQNIWRYPFGGLHMRTQFGYAHDLLLDAYDEYGFLEVIFLLIILVSGIRNLICFCKNKDISISYRLSFLCVYISILCEFCIEPIFEGIPWLFVCYCLLNGCIYGLNCAHLERQCDRGEVREGIAD